MQNISREEAISLGQSWFFTGKPCKNGHIDKKGVKRWNCYQCTREYKKAQRDKNIELVRKQKRDSYRRNADKINQKAKEKYPEVKAERLSYLKDYYQKNKEVLKEKSKEYFRNNKEKVYKYKKIWIKTDLGKNTTRALKINRRKAGKITAHQVKELKLNFCNKCYWCDCDVSSAYHIDHYVPIASGGTSDFNNLVLSCPSCNISKNKKSPYEFAISKGKLL